MMFWGNNPQQKRALFTEGDFGETYRATERFQIGSFG